MQQINQGLIVSPGNGEYGVSLQETQPIMYLQDVTNKTHNSEKHELKNEQVKELAPRNMGGAHNLVRGYRGGVYRCVTVHECEGLKK